MIRYTPLDATLHRNAGLQSPPPGQGPFLHATGTTACRLVASELDQALAYYPLGFREIPGDSRYDLIAILSLEPGINYFASTEGYWNAPYIPGWFRGHPFRLLPKEGSNQYMLCVDTDNGRFIAEAGADDHRFFLPDGTPSEQLQAILKFWTAYESEYHKTLRLIRQLDQHGLIVPWPIQLREGAQAPAKNLEGFFHIDARRLQDCSGDALRELAQSGALRLAYAQLLSMPRMAGLVDMMRSRKSGQAPAKAAVNFDLGGDTLDLSFLKN
jgi:hypothetical protein